MLFRVKPSVGNILAIIFLCVSFSVNLFGQTPVAVHGQLSIDGSKMVDQNGDQCQLRGLSFFWSNWMGKYWNYETVKWLRDDWNCNVVRAAMGVSTDDNSGYLGKPELELHKLEEVIEAAIDLGIYVVVDWHSHHAENETEEAKEFFAYIAEKYGNYPNIIYETYNEPITDWGTIKTYHEAVLTEIRAFDSNNVVILGTSFYSQNVEEAIANPVEGDNLCYALHYYADTHTFWDMVDRVSEKGYHIFVSEFGTCSSSGDGGVNVGNSNTWWDKLDQHGVSWCNWAISDKDEAASIVVPGSSIYGGWSPESELTASGTLVRNRLLSYPTTAAPTDIAPYITSNPRSLSIPAGFDAVFNVEAVGGTPIEYQWYFEGEAIVGATSSQLTVASADDESVGEYYCVLSNSYGETTSKTVTLDIRYRSLFYESAQSVPGVIQFEDFDNGGQNIGYFDASYGNSGGSYREGDVDIEAIKGQADQYAVGFTDPGEWLAYTVEVGWDDAYDVDVYYASQEGGGTFSILVDGNAVATDVEVSSTGDWFTYNKHSVSFDLTKGEHIIQFQIGKSGYNIDYMELKSQNPPKTAPIITTQPKNIAARVGKQAFIYVSAVGENPLLYQWYRNDTLIEGATDPVYEISSVAPSDAGEYYVTITNSLGDETSETATIEVVNTSAYQGIPAVIPGMVMCKNYDEGGNGDGYYDSSEGCEGTAYRSGDDVDTETCTDGGTGYSIGYIVADEWLNYSVNVEYSGTYTVGFRVASGSDNIIGALVMSVDGMPATETINVENTGGWTEWTTLETSVELSKGAHVLTLKANQGDFNLNYIEFKSQHIQQDITLKNGWNLVALNVKTEDMSPQTIFASVESCVVKSADTFYDSSLDSLFNLLTEINNTEAYLVYNGGEETTVSITGEVSSDVFDASALQSGWNLVSAGAETIKLSDLPDNVIAVKNFEGFYEAGSMTSTLSEMKAGKPYFILIE